MHTLTGHTGPVYAVAVSADGRRAVSSGNDRTVRVWDLEAGTAVHTLTGHAERVDRGGGQRRRPPRGLRRRGQDRRVWDVAHGVKLASFAAEHPITVLAVTPPGTLVIVGTSAGPVHLLELCAYE